MARRTYGQFEGLARALDIVGERWTLLLIRELLLGPQRYKDLLGGLPGIGTNLLAARLKRLEQAGLVRRRSLPPPAGSTVYELTGRGSELEPAVLALARWGTQSMDRPERDEILRPGWGVLAIQTSFRPEAARGVRETYELRIEGDVFHIIIDDGTMQARQGPAARPDLVLSTDVETFLALATRQLSPLEAVAGGRAEIRGDPEVALRAREILGLPEPDLSGLAPGELPPGQMAVALAATFRPDAARGVNDTYEFHIGDEIFHMIVNDGNLKTRRGHAADPDLVFSTDLKTFLALGAGQLDTMETIERGRVTFTGDTDALKRCIPMFGYSTPERSAEG